MNRRELIVTLLSAATLPLMPACAAHDDAAKTTPPGDADALALLSDVGDNLTRLFPEVATQLGLDTGARAALRSQLMDRSAAGRQHIADVVRADLARVNAIDASKLSHATRTSVEVVRSAYATALEGLALPYGDTTVGSWRNTPYTVIQNVGAYLDIPRALDSDHRIENAADAEAYVVRLQSYAKQLDGETGRMKDARTLGLVPPAFLIDKALGQIRLSAKNAREGGSLVESIERRTKTIPGDWVKRARTIAAQEVAPALERQIVELESERAVATGDPGISARPRGDEFYRWALHASTTTTMSPDDIHETGKRELEELQARMGEILKKLNYTTGTVGERMKALAAGPGLSVPRHRCRPRRNSRLRGSTAELGPRAGAAHVQHRRTPEHGSETAAPRGGAGRTRGIWRRWVDRRKDSRTVLDQPPNDEPAQQIQSAGFSVS
jgi:uncharacterized protein (DUF885 family)